MNDFWDAWERNAIQNLRREWGLDQINSAPRINTPSPGPSGSRVKSPLLSSSKRSTTKKLSLKSSATQTLSSSKKVPPLKIKIPKHHHSVRDVVQCKSLTLKKQRCKKRTAK